MRKITKGTKSNSPVTDSNEINNDIHSEENAVFPGTENPDAQPQTEVSAENAAPDEPKTAEKTQDEPQSDEKGENNGESETADEQNNEPTDEDYEPKNEMYTDTFDTEIPQESAPVAKRRPGKKVNVSKLIKTLATVVICVIIVISLFRGAAMIASLFRGKIGADSQPEEIVMTSSGTLAYTRFQRGVLVANSGTVSYHNSKNDIVWEKAGYDGSPVIKGAGKYALVAYVGTPNALLFTGSEAVSVTGTGSIVSSCVNENGYFALVMTEDGYKNQIVVFDNNGNVIYRWHSAENYVTCVAISPDNKNMVASTIGFSDNSFSGGVMIFDFASEKPYAGQQESENIIMAINFVNPNRFVVIGDAGTSYYKTNGTKIKDIDYGGKKLTTFDVCDDGQTILCFSKDDSAMSNSDIYAYTSKGKEKGHFETEGRALSISCCEGKVLVARENAYDLLNENCHWMRTIPVVKDIKNSVLFDKGRYSFVISGNTARVIRVD